MTPLGVWPHLPAGWEFRPLKRIARLNASTLSEESPSASVIRYVDIGNIRDGRIVAPEVLTFAEAPSRARRIVRRGDVIVSTVRTYLKAVALIDGDDDALVVSTGFAVLSPVEQVHSRFLWYAAQSEPFVSDVMRHSEGVSYPAIPPERLAKLKVPFPRISIQQRIADFLDRETAKIDGAIAAQQQVLALLEEETLSATWRAVTNGVAGPVAMKDSRAWMGPIAAHWDRRRIVTVAKMDSGHTPNCQVDDYWEGGDIPWVSLNDTGFLETHDYISETAKHVTAAGLTNSSAHMLPAGTVVFSRDATIGRCAIASCPLAVSQHFIAWICGPELVPEYLLLALRCMRRELERLSTGATIRTIGMPEVRTLVIPLPPIDEQRSIVHHVAELKMKSDERKALVRRLLTLAREYRAGLITAAVTGQIDVPDHVR